MVKVKKDLTGKTFDKLTVLYQIEDYVAPSGGHYAMYRCVCDCEQHNIVDIIGRDLLSGNTKSCGCLQREAISQIGKTSKKFNTFVLNNDYGIGYTTNTNKPFYFDLEDYDKIKDICWNFSYGYVRGWNGSTHIKMHKLIMNCFGNEYDVHHINGNKLDNRKHNLIVLTHNQHTLLHHKIKKQGKMFSRKEIELKFKFKE